MRRRDFITLFGSAAAVWPFEASAQQSDQLRHIVVLGTTQSDWAEWTASFAERLRQHGWMEGRTIAIEYRWSEARPESVAAVAAAFAQQKPDVIVTYGAAASTLKQASTSTPIVFAVAVDPVGSGLVASLSRPGDNITGLSIQQTDTVGRRLEFLREVVPNLRRLAIIFDGGYLGSVAENGQVRAVAQNLGLETTPHDIRRAEDIAPAFDVIKGQADALYVAENALASVNRATIVTLALSARLPAISTPSAFARVGLLISYGPNFLAMFQRAADLVDKILRGAKPGDIPVEQPTKFDLVINLKTAKTLGLAVPEKLLALADEVIE
jgi:putative tryptophan/tyrosine transport system substrate-binding protein